MVALLKAVRNGTPTEAAAALGTLEAECARWV